jgi:X-Pro dipeptidyl-peptidase
VPGLATIVPIAGYTSGYENLRANDTITWFKGGPAWQSQRVAADPEKCAVVSQEQLGLWRQHSWESAMTARSGKPS